MRVHVKQTSQWGTRIPSFTASLCVHVSVIAWIGFFGPILAPPPRERPETVADRFKIVWYPMVAIPEISLEPKSSPQNSIPELMPLLDKTIFSTSAKAELRKQIVWQPTPTVLPKEVPTPDVLEFGRLSLPHPSKPTPKALDPPIQATQPTPAIDFIVPPTLPEGREPKMTLPLASFLGMQEFPKAPARKFVPPPARAYSATLAPPEEPPSLERNDSGNQPISKLVVGLEPVNRLTTLPEGSLRTLVSARSEETISSNAGNSVSGSVTVPGVVVRKGIDDPPLSPKSSPKASTQERARAAARATVSAPLRSSSRSLPNVVEAVFRERTIYLCLLEVLVPTEDAGNPFWFAERGAREGGVALMRAPILVRGHIPALPARTGSGNKVYLKLMIGKEGVVQSVNFIPSSDDPFSHVILQALASWEFVPATRNGQPVEVDAIVEIPAQPAISVSGK